MGRGVLRIGVAQAGVYGVEGGRGRLAIRKEIPLRCASVALCLASVAACLV